MYQLADTLVSGALIQFICTVFLGYLSGCFYPISFFPPFMRTLSLFIPSGLAREYMSSVLTGSLSAEIVIAVSGYFLCLMGLSVAVRRFRVQRG
jgi:ABC-2 type transport system permease protein